MELLRESRVNDERAIFMLGVLAARRYSNTPTVCTPSARAHVAVGVFLFRTGISVELSKLPLAPPPIACAALYLRVSTDDQTRNYGLDVQRQRCTAMATVKGWQLAGEYTDEGVSGTKSAADRPGLARLMEDVRAGTIDAVIVLALDRLGRKTRLVLELVEEFVAAGAVLVSCKESLDTSSPQGQFVLTMFAALAQLDRDMIVQRTTDGRNARGGLDGEKGGAIPYGYARTEGRLTVVERQAETVRYILHHRDAGKSYHQIARELNAQGVPGPKGGQWHGRSVKIVCDHCAIYAGGLRGASAECWPALI